MTDKTEKEYRTLLADLNKALSDRTGTATSDRVILRAAVCAYVAAEQARGTTLKSVIQTVEEILREAEQAAASATDATERRDGDLAKQLVAWCVEFGGNGGGVFV
ncbi:MAG TPA: hypothetical protein VHE82_01465 [Gemmatimonadaceae bacterium]|nr:hypothetical protein [Gemmatimonadaceae bacterium]